VKHLLPGGRGAPSAFQQFGAQHQSESMRESERAPTRISPLQSVSGQTHCLEGSYKYPDPNFGHHSSRSSYTGKSPPQSGIGQTPSSASVSGRQSPSFAPGFARSSFTQRSRTTAVRDFGNQQVPESTQRSFVSGTRTPSIAQESQRTSNTQGSTGQHSASSGGSYRPESTQQSYGRGFRAQSPSLRSGMSQETARQPGTYSQPQDDASMRSEATTPRIRTVSPSFISETSTQHSARRSGTYKQQQGSASVISEATSPERDRRQSRGSTPRPPMYRPPPQRYRAPKPPSGHGSLYD